jgi:hypothetical protein
MYVNFDYLDVKENNNKMKTHKIIYSVLSLLLITSMGFGQGVTVKPGTNIIVDGGTTLKVADGDNLTIEDDLTFSPSLLERGTLAFTGGGNLEVQQYLVEDQYHIVSSPVSDEIIGAFMDMYLYSFDEPTNYFNNLFNPVTIPLNVGEGYFVWSVPSAPDYVNLNGTSNKTDVPVTLTVTPATNNSGWNLLGNPFPCAIDWNGNTSWALNNVASTVYMFDPAGGNYKTWNFNTGIGTNGQANGHIAATQGFWIRTSDTIASQSSYSLTIPADEKLADATTDFYKEAGSEENLLRIKIEKNSWSDEYVLAINVNATEGFDNDYDAYKMFPNSAAPLIYSTIGNTKLGVSSIPNIEIGDIVPLQFIPKDGGAYELSVNDLQSIIPELPVYLEDKKTQYFQNLREYGEYSFDSEMSDEIDRFVIYFANPMGLDDLTDPLNDVVIWSWQNTVIVNTPDSFSGELHIYDMLGKLVVSSVLQDGRNELQLAGSEGFFIVKVVTEEGMKSEKVLIK